MLKIHINNVGNFNKIFNNNFNFKKFSNACDNEAIQHC